MQTITHPATRAFRDASSAAPTNTPKEHAMNRIQTPVIAQALISNHAETLVSTPVIAQALTTNHAETLVSTPVIAQALTTNHAETLVSR